MLLLVIFIVFAGALSWSNGTHIKRRSVIEEMKGLQWLNRNWRINWSGEMVKRLRRGNKTNHVIRLSEALRRTVMSTLLPALNEGMGNPWFYFYFSFL
jgi:hypothetical protein